MSSPKALNIIYGGQVNPGSKLLTAVFLSLAMLVPSMTSAVRSVPTKMPKAIRPNSRKFCMKLIQLHWPKQ
jgi:hypothetical protein